MTKDSPESEAASSSESDSSKREDAATTESNQPEGTEDDKKMSLTDHLQELRKRLVIIISILGVAFVICWGFSELIVKFIQYPVLPYLNNLQFDDLTEPFFTHLKAAFYAAVFLTFPIIVWQLWLFIMPALYRKEKGVAFPFLLLSYPLFVGGSLFCYMIVFPYAVEFLIGFDSSLVPSLRVGSYLSFTLRLMFVFGLVFEMPLISMLLTRMGFITPTFLSKNRRYALIIVFVAAAVLTPPDVFTQMLLAIPLILLYEVSIIVSRLTKRKQDIS